MPTRRSRTRHSRRMFAAIAALALIYTVLAYVLVPLGWDYLSEPLFQPSDGVPRLTETRDHHAGDPINVALVGDEAAIKSAMAAAGWFAPDPLGFKSDLDIAADIILDRAYVTAPVSRLFLFGRSEDLAFEKPAGPDPDTRHHVRLWLLAEDEGTQKPGVYVGAASFDRGIGISHETGQLTHHIAPDVDHERDRLKTDLMQTGQLSDHEMVAGFHELRTGFNGGGDPWTTDGDLWAGVLRAQK
ncbi:LssY C-terminal domain-containing protein [Hoeflea sp. IMCC20628]|uniref:LssY C-terminal domain-containing protein n=1 Tax=Hoeflea sp. IMCC20628 TaxID=1620421 RepID=UPI0018CEDF5A|nr:LssY C-terminal domain-containing protein [Hoeflea sp. IMCC20628]